MLMMWKTVAHPNDLEKLIYPSRLAIRMQVSDDILEIKEPNWV